MNQPLKKTEHELKELVRRLHYVTSDQREMLHAALLVHQAQRGHLDVRNVKELLDHLYKAKLISKSARDSLLKKLFT